MDESMEAFWRATKAGKPPEDWREVKMIPPATAPGGSGENA